MTKETGITSIITIRITTEIPLRGDKLVDSDVSRAELVAMLRQAQGERDEAQRRELNLESELTKERFKTEAIESQARESIRIWRSGEPPVGLLRAGPAGVARVAMAKAHIREATDLLLRSGLPGEAKVTADLESHLGDIVRAASRN